MAEIVIKIMVELLSVLAIATKQINEGRLSMFVLACTITNCLTVAEKYAKKILGEKNVESVFLRLDRLTAEESKTAVVQTLDVAYGLVKNMQVVMEGAHSRYI